MSDEDEEPLLPGLHILHDDPFACFDSSDDECCDDCNNYNEESPGETSTDKQEIIRDPGNGVLAFHAGTEIALLHYVKTELAKQKLHSTGNNDDNGERTPVEASISRAKTVLDLVDSYCLSRHWMMHIGPEKADPLKEFLWKSLSAHQTNRTQNNHEFTFVELGTYCGYSSIFFAKTILEHSVGNEHTFHIYSFEVVPGFASVAKELIRLAGMDNYVTVILIQDPDEVLSSKNRSIATEAQTGEVEGCSISGELRRRLAATDSSSSSSRNDDTAATTRIDFLFVDHDKSLYLANLKELETFGFVWAGTYVAADNVIFAQIDDYREYMQQHARDGIVNTRLEDSLRIEYCQPEWQTIQRKHGKTDDEASELRDGIEFSIYLKDPWMQKNNE